MLADIDTLKLAESFRSQGDFLVVPDFVPAPLLQRLLAELPRLEAAVHRNYIPRHKKGGSISRFELDRLAPAFGELYRLPALAQCLDQITGHKLLPYPPADPHTYALYYYTEEGDHIGWHYDTSYYRGLRYTVLVGLVDRSDSRLEYQLPPTAGAENAGKTRELAIAPGMLVLFGDKLHHRVTPIGAHQQRVVLTLEYVTDPSMSPWWRFVSNMKDSIAYFGLSGVFQRRKGA